MTEKNLSAIFGEALKGLPDAGILPSVNVTPGDDASLALALVLDALEGSTECDVPVRVYGKNHEFLGLFVPVSLVEPSVNLSNIIRDIH